MRAFIPITAVVLAAGVSSRMGDFKPLLPMKGIPLLEIVVKRVLSFPFYEVKAVVGFKEEEIRKSITCNDSRFRWVSNHHYLDGLSSSIKAAGESYNAESRGMLIFLGDQPLIQKSTIQRMIDIIVEQNLDQTKCIAQPTYNGNPGHPVYLSPQMIPYLQTITGDRGAKAIFHVAEKQIYVQVEDAGIHIDIDTKSDYLTYLHVVENEHRNTSKKGYL